jgi:hypothetical protein
LTKWKLKPESEPLPISFTHDQYVGTSWIMFHSHSKTESRYIKTSSILLKPKIDCYAEWTNDTLYPTNKIRIPVDKSSIIKKK